MIGARAAILFYKLEECSVCDSMALNTLTLVSIHQVPNPIEKEVEAGRMTLFDTWVHVMPSSQDPSLPK